MREIIRGIVITSLPLAPGAVSWETLGTRCGIVSGKCDTFCYFRISNFLLSRSRNEGSFRDHQDHSGVSRFHNFSCDLAQLIHEQLSCFFWVLLSPKSSCFTWKCFVSLGLKRTEPTRVLEETFSRYCAVYFWIQYTLCQIRWCTLVANPVVCDHSRPRTLR